MYKRQLLPIAVAGIDIKALLDGAAAAREAYAEPDLSRNDCYKYAVPVSYTHLDVYKRQNALRAGSAAGRQRRRFDNAGEGNLQIGNHLVGHNRGAVSYTHLPNMGKVKPNTVKSREGKINKKLKITFSIIAVKLYFNGV